MKKNDFPTNPVAFAQYVWENIEVGDTLVDRLRNFWKVTSYETYNGRKIRISIRCIDSKSCAGGYNNGEYEKLTRYDLARKYYFYINNIAVPIPAVEDWNVKTFVQNYNTLWSILDVLKIPTKEECADIFSIFYLTQETERDLEEKNKKLSTCRTLKDLKSKFSEYDLDGDKIREKCVNCLPKEDTKMTENEKNYLLKNKGKTGVDTQLKSAFYSQEDLDAAIEKIGDFLETHTNTVKNKCKESVKKFAGFSDEDLDEICTRVVDTFYSASDFSKKTFDEFKSWMKEKYKDYTKEVKEEPKTKTETVKVNNNQSVVTVDNNDTEMARIDSVYKLSEDNLKKFPYLDKYINNFKDNEDEGNEGDTEDGTDFVNRPFHIGDIVIDKNGNVGYISEICSRDNTWFYYYVPVVIEPNHIAFKVQKPLDSTLENYIQIGAWDLTYSGARKNLSGFKEFKNLSLTYNKELPEELLKEFLNKNKESLSKKKTNEKDSNTSTTDSINPPLNAKTDNADSLPKYLSKLNLTGSAYSYEVNTKLTTDIVRKLNEVIEALNAITLYHLNEAQEEKRRRQLEER